MITVMKAPPFATIQDLGRPGFRDVGVPISGLADRETGNTVNSLLGNDPNAAMIEWAVAGGTLRFDRAGTVAIGGAEAACSVNGVAVDSLTPFEVSAGDEIVVSRIVSGRFLLIAVRGGIDVPVVLGSRSTLVSAAFGGFEGRRLKTGDRLPVGNLTLSHPARSGALRETRYHGRRPEQHQRDVVQDVCMIDVMRGPQSSLFNDAAWSDFLGAVLMVSRASDRSGYRLEGVTMTHGGSAALPSEPTCVGAIQVPAGGAPIVIMHDGPTVGGYPKIAVIRSSCMSRFAQLAPGARVRFALG
jgi:antagonist of KipI